LNPRGKWLSSEVSQVRARERAYGPLVFLMEGRTRIGSGCTREFHYEFSRVFKERIAILGWGSLIWDPGDLPNEGRWEKGGPELPIEFSRISDNGRLTLVIDPINGYSVGTRFVLSRRRHLDDAISDLARREGTKEKYIGFVDLQKRDRRSDTKRTAVEPIETWAAGRGFDGVLWTDLPSNFKEQTGTNFSIKRAVEYLHRLPSSLARRAREYIAKAPPEIDTPVRKKLRETGWLIET
jgi:hypothetical protein